MHLQGPQVSHDRSVQGRSSPKLYSFVDKFPRDMHCAWWSELLVALVGLFVSAVGQVGSGCLDLYGSWMCCNGVSPVDGRGSYPFQEIWEGMGRMG